MHEPLKNIFESSWLEIFSINFLQEKYNNIEFLDCNTLETKLFCSGLNRVYYLFLSHKLKFLTKYMTHGHSWLLEKANTRDYNSDKDSFISKITFHKMIFIQNSKHFER